MDSTKFKFDQLFFNDNSYKKTPTSRCFSGLFSLINLSQINESNMKANPIMVLPRGQNKSQEQTILSFYIVLDKSNLQKIWILKNTRQKMVNFSIILINFVWNICWIPNFCSLISTISLIILLKQRKCYSLDI